MSQSPLHLLSNVEKSTSALKKLMALKRTLANPACRVLGNLTPNTGLLRKILRPQGIELPDTSTPQRPLNFPRPSRLNQPWNALSLHDLSNNLRRPLLSPIRPSATLVGYISPLFHGGSPRIFSPIQLRQPMASPNIMEASVRPVAFLPARPLTYNQARYEFQARRRREELGGDLAMPDSPGADYEDF